MIIAASAIVCLFFRPEFRDGKKKSEQVETLTLHYLNEDDRAYGLAGMALSAVALDASDLISSISLDSEDNMVLFSDGYYFIGSPSVSPKATWGSMVRNFQITSAMVVANLFARSLVRMKTAVPHDLLNTLHDEIIREGRETCDLEDDEAEGVYSKALTYNRQIFGNTRLHPAIAKFAGAISCRRTLSAQEILDELSQLGITAR